MSVILEKLRGTKFGRTGLVVGSVAGGLLALDLIGFVATVYFSAELLQAAEAAGVAELLPK
jgi:3-dehydroquinate synthetase